MVSLTVIFWMYIILFAIIGAMRGWAKELLVSFSVILALALNHLLRRYIPMVTSLDIASTSLFWIRVGITVPLVFFGYQTVASIGHLASKAKKDKLQDALFGAVMGGVNGYLVMGTLWNYLDEAKYPFKGIFITPPSDIAAEIAEMMLKMPPHFLGEPGIYFAVIIAFIFIIVVYV